MKHTPGPWKVFSDETITVRNAQGGTVAAMGWLCELLAGPRRSSVEVHANARLIAAAPKMLKALKLIAEGCEINGDGPTLEIANMAIWEAEGETQ